MTDCFSCLRAAPRTGSGRHSHRLIARFLPGFVLLIASAGLVGGCGPGYLDHSEKVPATAENKEIFAVLKAYHQAMEDRDIDAIKGLVSQRYHENGGTTDTDIDDYGVDKLHSDVLLKLRDNVKKLQFKLRLIAVDVELDQATADYEYQGRVLLTEGGRDAYKTWTEANRMEFVREEGAWKIVKGL